MCTEFHIRLPSRLEYLFLCIRRRARSATVAYGMNRADYSYIPGGVISGTALIRPDFPELLEFPYLWQQGEYVLGGGSSDYMFLVLAARKVLLENKGNYSE